MICGWIFTSLVDGIALHLTCTGINACFLCWTFLCKCLIIIRYLGPRLLPPASWQPGPRSCAHLSNPMQELSAHRGIFCLVVLSFSIRSGQSRGQTAISDTLLYWFLVYGAVNQGVKPRSPIPCYTGLSYTGRSVKGLHRGLLYLVKLVFSIRGGQSRGQAAVSCKIP